MNKKNNKLFAFPPEEELAKVCQEMSDPNYQRINQTLSSQATDLEKTKYQICQKILAYQQENHLAVEEVAQRVHLSVPETEDVFFAKIDKFTLDNLVRYLESLHISFQLKLDQNTIQT